MIWNRKHLLDIESLSADEILTVLDTAKAFKAVGERAIKKVPALRGKTVINLFIEPSTRTRISFELAQQRLSADIVNFTADASSLKKGETLKDTARNLEALNADFIVIRHSAAGAAHFLARTLNTHVINAGDGSHEHPTQALLDALTIKRRKGRVDGLVVTICGDILHSRVARSNMLCLTALGAQVRVVAPPALMPSDIGLFGLQAFHHFDDALPGSDVVMMLRLQNERMQGDFIPSPREFFHLYGLDARRLSLAKPDALVMHPGPMNRGVEIASHIADDLERSAITEQVEMGVAMRMACLDVLTRRARGVEGWS